MGLWNVGIVYRSSDVAMLLAEPSHSLCKRIHTQTEMVSPNRDEVHSMVSENAASQMIGGSLNQYDIAWRGQQGRKVVEGL